MNPNYKAMKKHFHFITIFMLLFLFIGCLYVPPVGRQIGNEELKTIEIGSTTKAEVTNLLGKPDLLENERFYVYEAGQNFGYIVVFIDPGGIGSLSEERYRLLFEFNVNEVVKRYHIEPIYLANWAGISDGWENPDNQTTSGKEALFQKTNFKELILLEHGFFSGALLFHLTARWLLPIFIKKVYG
jgi:hypothetical protein